MGVEQWVTASPASRRSPPRPWSQVCCRRGSRAASPTRPPRRRRRRSRRRRRAGRTRRSRRARVLPRCRPRPRGPGRRRPRRSLGTTSSAINYAARTGDTRGPEEAGHSASCDVVRGDRRQHRQGLSPRAATSDRQGWRIAIHSSADQSRPKRAVAVLDVLAQRCPRVLVSGEAANASVSLRRGRQPMTMFMRLDPAGMAVATARPGGVMIAPSAPLRSRRWCIANFVTALRRLYAGCRLPVALIDETSTGVCQVPTDLEIIGNKANAASGNPVTCER